MLQLPILFGIPLSCSLILLSHLSNGYHISCKTGPCLCMGSNIFTTIIKSTLTNGIHNFLLTVREVVENPINDQRDNKDNKCRKTIESLYKKIHLLSIHYPQIWKSCLRADTDFPRLLVRRFSDVQPFS